MRMEELRTGWFGYRKDSVYQLISSMEEDFSARLLEKDAQHAQLFRQAQEQIAELRAALAAAQEELLAHQRDQNQISGALLDAQDYARRLRADAQAQEEQLRGELQAEARRQRERLEVYGRQIGQLHARIGSLLGEMEAQSRDMEEQIAALAGQAPEPNLSLFREPVGSGD